MLNDDMFVKFVYDDSGLSSRLDESDEKLKEHDELIKELQKKLENLAAHSQLEFMQDSLTKEFEKRVSEINNKFQNLFNQVNSSVEKIQSLSDNIDSKLNTLTEYVDSKVQQCYDNIMISVTNDHSRLGSFEERILECESKLNNQRKELNHCHTYIQQLASSIASLNNADVVLDKNLQVNLKESIDYVKINFQNLYEELGKLKSVSPPSNNTKSGISDNLSVLLQLQQQNQSINRIQSSSQKPSILSPHVQKPGRNFSSQSINQKQQQSQTQQLQNKEPIMGSGKNYNDTDFQNSLNNEIQQDKSDLETKNDLSSERENQPQQSSKSPPLLPPQQTQKQNQNTAELSNVNIKDTPINNINNSSSNTFSASTTKNPSVSSNASSVNSNQMQQHQQQTNSTRTKESALSYDLTIVRPYSEIHVHWQDRPRLPEIRPFIKIEEVVDHVYKLQPFLQAYLSAYHGKLVESCAQIQQKVDKNLVEKMFERMQSIVADINVALNRLKDEVQQTATRKEINGFLEELTKSMRCDAQTAVGRVRCIACGRETTQITGAMTEAEIERKLGSNTPNSLVKGMMNHKPGVSYSSTEGFDSAIVEEPRSKRPAQGLLPQSQHSQLQQPLAKTRAKLQ